MKSPLPSLNSALGTWSLRNRLVLGVVALGAAGFLIFGIAAGIAFKTFLIGKVDTELKEITTGSLLRLDRAGIEFEKEALKEEDDQLFKPVEPLRDVPSAVSITLLSANGEVAGVVGGDAHTAQLTNLIAKMSPAEIASHSHLPFTIESTKTSPRFRALVQPLPSGFGTVVTAVSLEDVYKTLSRLKILFLLIGFLVLLAIAIFSRKIIKIGLRPLTDVEVTAQAIASGDLSARLPDAKPDTEVGRLVSSLNQMLNRIEESFAVRVESENKLRRFVADASHELRTPLTAIRGFAELHRQGAVTGEEKTAELIGRIEKESIRMGSLVENLLLLARLDQFRKVEQVPIDLKVLIREVVASALASGPNHPIEIELPNDDVFILGEPDQIHQVVANLLANTRAHTPPRTKTKIALSQNENERTISVSDSGPGITQEEQVRIFERFYRADPSRARASVAIGASGSSSGGSGLGLSIVEAVMSAHGGTVSLDSTLGKGSTFVLHFPINENI